MPASCRRFRIRTGMCIHCALVVNELRGCPAQASHALLGSRLTWRATRLPRSLPAMISQYPNVPPNRLMTLLQRQCNANNGSLLVDSLLRPAPVDSKSAAPFALPRPFPQSTLPLSRSPILFPLRRRLAASWQPGTPQASSPSNAVSVLSSPTFRRPSATHQLAVGILPDVSRSKLRPVAHFSGHRWLPVCCLRVDPSSRVIVTGGDDKCVDSI